uniref:Major facilitator superfamily (MFS) profile domain-containing protein n=1 Tax=Chromera velia CCMP2878 TaxID=1169474 RepID=A0A0G4FQ32_9ALVE|eukprot:Cvel_18191.t1-p1 / transcript=Cvel_18191.t1 / gene=Cvel_18191 / organism=Chromera_velia_CCMP2878 / gene_product=hypothetical protein / transcript_product=hypothetical protein / location=Cvel_scaffold1492:36733-44911(-) / protein_length=626 / sequence_SO=supercontig / SO=protein_coding / is_pseudo=false
MQRRPLAVIQRPRRDTAAAFLTAGTHTPRGRGRQRQREKTSFRPIPKEVDESFDNNLHLLPGSQNFEGPRGAAWPLSVLLPAGGSNPKGVCLGSSKRDLESDVGEGNGKGNGEDGVGEGGESFNLEAAAGGSATNGEALGVESPFPFAVLGTLLLIYVNNQWSRTLLSYLVDFQADPLDVRSKFEFMNVDLSFDASAYSLLASIVFSLLYAFTGVFAGRVVDTREKRNVAAWSCGLWSVATFLQGASQSFEQLAAARVLQGVAQAFCAPAAYSILADAASASRRATANSLYSSGVYLGQALASLSILLDTRIGWRATCAVVGASGLLSAFLPYLSVPATPPASLPSSSSSSPSSEDSSRSLPVVLSFEDEDKASSSSSSSPSSSPSSSVGKGTERRGEADLIEVGENFPEVLQKILSNKVVVLTLIATAFRFAAGFAIGVWKAPLFRALYPEDASTFSLVNAGIVGGAGALSSVGGGLLSDALEKRGQSAAGRALVPAVASLLAAPLWAAVCGGSSFNVAVSLLLVEYLVAECWFGPTIALLQTQVPSSLTGTTQGLFQVTTLFGNALPVLLGAEVARRGQSAEAIAAVVGTSVAAAYVASGIFFALAGAAVASDEAQKEKKSMNG